MRRLSELEGICLGIVVNFGPCTAYAVRRELRKSPSSHWQASAGSVYPLLSRLEDEGLVAADVDSNDGRGRRLLSAGKSGKAALRAWIRAGADDALISSVTDPIRSRMFFLGTLRPAEQQKYLDNAIDLLGEYLKETQLRLAAADASIDQFDFFGAMGAMRLTETRLDWLKAVRRDLTA